MASKRLPKLSTTITEGTEQEKWTKSLAFRVSAQTRETNKRLNAQTELLSSILDSMQTVVNVLKNGFNDLNTTLLQNRQENEQKQRVNQLKESENEIEEKNPNGFQIL